MDLRLKRLAESSLEMALEKANHYRNLNEPEEAESICRDILATKPDHHGALRTLGLALTDRFARSWSAVFDEAIDTFKKLPSEYEREYYVGVAWERCAKAQLEANEAWNALTSFEHALVHFERAEALTTEANPDPLLRWNRCVRALETDPLLLEAQASPLSHEFGD
jgi:hypothetical protein